MIGMIGSSRQPHSQLELVSSHVLLLSLKQLLKGGMSRSVHAHRVRI